MANERIIIVGGGLAGLMATIKAGEAGVQCIYFHWFLLNVPTLYVRKAALTVR